KKIWERKAYFKNIDPDLKFDYTVVICPDLLDTDALKYIKKRSKKSIVYYWDGFDHFPKYKESLPYFDEHFTFDPHDAKTYNLKFLPNFYFVEDRNQNPSTDLFFLSSFDSRYPIIEQIAATLEKQNSKLKRSEEHTSELQSRENLVCRLLLEKKNLDNRETLQPKDNAQDH